MANQNAPVRASHLLLQVASLEQPNANQTQEEQYSSPVNFNFGDARGQKAPTADQATTPPAKPGFKAS